MGEARDSLRTIHLVANPVSGLPRLRQPLSRVLDALSGTGIEIVVRKTEGPGHATVLAREACRAEVDAVVVVGGDGTVNEALNGMEGDRTALGTIPAGTSNVLALELKIPFRPEGAARVLVRNRRRRLDVGVANGRRFLESVGVGWDGEVVHRMAARRKGHGGKHRYVRPIVFASREFRFPHLLVTSGDRIVTASTVVACNTRSYAAAFCLAPLALPDDGLLDFVLFRTGHRRDVPRWVLAATLRRLPRYREVQYRRGRDLRVESEEPVPYQVDGDPGGHTPVEIELIPSAVEMIVP